jgi:adenosine deaminase
MIFTGAAAHHSFIVLTSFTILSLRDMLRRWVVGMDFGGNPEKTGEEHSFRHFLPCFSRARNHNLKVTSHIAEIFNASDTDTIIDFVPERLGHGVRMEDEQIGRIATERIVMEICPTSNIHTLALVDKADAADAKEEKEEGVGVGVGVGIDDASLVVELEARARYCSVRSMGEVIHHLPMCTKISHLCVLYHMKCFFI